MTGITDRHSSRIPHSTLIMMTNATSTQSLCHQSLSCEVEPLIVHPCWTEEIISFVLIQLSAVIISAEPSSHLLIKQVDEGIITEIMTRLYAWTI